MRHDILGPEMSNHDPSLTGVRMFRPTIVRGKCRTASSSRERVFSLAPGSGETALTECDLGSRSGLWRVGEGGGFGGFCCGRIEFRPTVTPPRSKFKGPRGIHWHYSIHLSFRLSIRLGSSSIGRLFFGAFDGHKIGDDAAALPWCREVLYTPQFNSKIGGSQCLPMHLLRSNMTTSCRLQRSRCYVRTQAQLSYCTSRCMTHEVHA